MTGVLQEDVTKAAEQYATTSHAEPESKALLRAEQLLRHAVVPGHNKFFDRVSRLPGGLKFLIDMRHDLIVNDPFFLLFGSRSAFYFGADRSLFFIVLQTVDHSGPEPIRLLLVGFERVSQGKITVLVCGILGSGETYLAIACRLAGEDHSI